MWSSSSNCAKSRKEPDAMHCYEAARPLAAEMLQPLKIRADMAVALRKAGKQTQNSWLQRCRQCSQDILSNSLCSPSSLSLPLLFCTLCLCLRKKHWRHRIGNFFSLLHPLQRRSAQHEKQLWPCPPSQALIPGRLLGEDSAEDCGQFVSRSCQGVPRTATGCMGRPAACVGYVGPKYSLASWVFVGES